MISLIADGFPYGTIIGEKSGGGIGSAFKKTGWRKRSFCGGGAPEDTLECIDGGGFLGSGYVQGALVIHAGYRG